MLFTLGIAYYRGLSMMGKEIKVRTYNVLYCTVLMDQLVSVSVELLTFTTHTCIIKQNYKKPARLRRQA